MSIRSSHIARSHAIVYSPMQFLTVTELLITYKSNWLIIPEQWTLNRELNVGFHPGNIYIRYNVCRLYVQALKFRYKIFLSEMYGAVDKLTSEGRSNWFKIIIDRQVLSISILGCSLWYIFLVFPSHFCNIIFSEGYHPPSLYYCPQFTKYSLSRNIKIIIIIIIISIYIAPSI